MRFSHPLSDSFLTRIDPVILNEHHQETLHALRLRGKRVRDVMEMYLPAYGSQFEDCLNSVKQILGILGRIHDLDINLPILRKHGPGKFAISMQASMIVH